MKKIILITLLLIGSIGFINTAEAQKKGNDTEIQISVNYPVFSYEYIEGEDQDGNPLGKVDLQVHDRKGQTDDFNYHEMNAKSRDNQPLKGKLKVIFYEELGGFNFRLAETMEERNTPPNGTTCLLLEEVKLLPAHRVKYPDN